MLYIGDIFKSLLDTSATKVDIFWMSLNLARGQSRNVLYCVDEIYVLIFGDVIILCCICNKLPGSFCSLLYKWYISEDMMPFGGEYVMI